MASFLSQ